MNPMNTKLKNTLIIGGLVVVAGFALWMVPTNILTPTGMLQKGEMYQKTGRSALALEIYKKAVEMYPGSYDAHVHLGNAFLEVDEPELAKREFDKAMEIRGNSKGSYSAEISLARILIKEGKYKDAEDMLLKLGDDNDESLKAVLSDLYMAWGDSKFDTDRNFAVEKYKKACINLGDGSQELKQRVKIKVIRMYNELADNYIGNKEYDKAVQLLNDSVKFSDNPTSHVRLAEIYLKQKKKDEAIKEYELANKIDTTGQSAFYLSDLLIEKGVELVKDNKPDEAKKLFEQAQEVNPSVIIPAELLYTVALENIKTNLEKKISMNMVFPSVSFVLKNKSKDKLDFIKAQVVFLVNGKEISRIEKILVSDQNPLGSGKSSEKVTLSSVSGVRTTIKNQNIQAKVYLAYNSEEDWKIARSLRISNDKYKDSSYNNNITAVIDKKTMVPRPASVKQDPKPDTNMTTVETGTFKPDVEIKGPAIPERQPVQPSYNPPVSPSGVANPQPVAIPVQPQSAKRQQALPPM